MCHVAFVPRPPWPSSVELVLLCVCLCASEKVRSEFQVRGNAAASQACYAEWGVKPRASWAVAHFGDKQRSLQTASKMVFSNGLLDPWSAGGVLYNISESVVAVVIPTGGLVSRFYCSPSVLGFVLALARSVLTHTLLSVGAHHSDFMFENALDGEDVKAARALHRTHIARWIAEAREAP